MNTNTAILIFANSAEKEMISKSIHASELFESLNSETLKTAKKTGLPYFHISEKEQVGASFGERFTNAIQSIYDKGFDTVISIGNDTPHLQAKHILKAAQQLQKNAIALGPAKDGGFYLMGLKKAHFNAEAFLKLPWQTSNLNRSVSRFITSIGIRASYLETLSDIDSVSDLKHFIDSFKSISKSIKQLLLQLLTIKKETLHSHFISIDNYIETLHFNKGSPLVLPA